MDRGAWRATVHGDTTYRLNSNNNKYILVCMEQRHYRPVNETTSVCVTIAVILIGGKCQAECYIPH